MIERLRYLVFEVPLEHWKLIVGDIPVLRELWWDSAEHIRHQPGYRGPPGRLYCSSNGIGVSLELVVDFNQPNFPSVFWRTTLTRSDLARGVDYARNEVVARIFLQADPPIQLRHLQDGHQDSPDLPDSPLHPSSA
jgi:hypothetical protein